MFQLGGAAIVPTPLVHAWVPETLGAFNGIVIDDMDFDTRNEVYVAGSLGIWKWRQQ